MCVSCWFRVLGLSHGWIVQFIMPPPLSLGHGLLIIIIRSGERGGEVRRNRGRLAVREEGKNERSNGGKWMIRSEISVIGDLGFRSKARHNQKSRFKGVGMHSSCINMFACLFNVLPFFPESRDYPSSGWSVDRPAWWNPVSQQKRPGGSRG